MADGELTDKEKKALIEAILAQGNGEDDRNISYEDAVHLYDKLNPNNLDRPELASMPQWFVVWASDPNVTPAMADHDIRIIHGDTTGTLHAETALGITTDELVHGNDPILVGRATAFRENGGQPLPSEMSLGWNGLSPEASMTTTTMGGLAKYEEDLAKLLGPDASKSNFAPDPSQPASTTEPPVPDPSGLVMDAITPPMVDHGSYQKIAARLRSLGYFETDEGRQVLQEFMDHKLNVADHPGLDVSSLSFAAKQYRRTQPGHSMTKDYLLELRKDLATITANGAVGVKGQSSIDSLSGDTKFGFNTIVGNATTDPDGNIVYNDLGFENQDFRLGDLIDQRGMYERSGIFGLTQNQQDVAYNPPSNNPTMTESSFAEAQRAGVGPRNWDPSSFVTRQSGVDQSVAAASERLSLGFEDLTKSEARALVHSLSGEDLRNFQYTMYEAGFYGSQEPLWGINSIQDAYALEYLVGLSNSTGGTRSVGELIRRATMNNYTGPRLQVSNGRVENSSAVGTTRNVPIRTTATIGTDMDKIYEQIMGRDARQMPPELRTQLINGQRNREIQAMSALYGSNSGNTDLSNPDIQNVLGLTDMQVDNVAAIRESIDYMMNKTGRKLFLTPDVWEYWSNNVFSTVQAKTPQTEEIVLSAMITDAMTRYRNDIGQAVRSLVSGPYSFTAAPITDTNAANYNYAKDNSNSGRWADQMTRATNDLLMGNVLTGNVPAWIQGDQDVHGPSFNYHAPHNQDAPQFSLANRIAQLNPDGTGGGGLNFIDAYDYKGDLERAIRDMDPARADAYDFAKQATDFYSLLGSAV